MNKKVVKNADLDVLADYVRRRILGNRGDPETDQFPGVWQSIINVLRVSGRWDEKECYPTNKGAHPKVCRCCGRKS